MKFLFGDIVVVDDIYIGVVVKTWENKDGYSYEVYVRSYGVIKEYKECEIERYSVRHKELDEEEMYYQNNATQKHTSQEATNVDDTGRPCDFLREAPGFDPMDCPDYWSYCCPITMNKPNRKCSWTKRKLIDVIPNTSDELRFYV